MAASDSVVSSAAEAGGSRGEWSEEVPRLLGRYLLLRRIARGGMGEVFLASTTGIEGAERAVVVKIIRREHARDPSFIARFLDEARVQSQLQHSGVAQVLDATLDDTTGEPYAVLEHVEGRSLGDLRARAREVGHNLGWADAVALATLIAEALAHVHERQDPSGRALAIVHRDLSPQNVMVSYPGECKIIDFGTARGQNRRCHTVAGVVFAKPGYVAPEVANGDPGDARVDLYALGIMLWELVAGRRFLQGDAAAHMAAVSRNARNPPPVAASAGGPAALDAIIAKLTAFDREARCASGRAAAAELARLLTSAQALPSGERGVRPRVAHLMSALFPGEPGRTRREFARLVADAHAHVANAGAPREPSAPPPPPDPPRSVREGDVLPGTRYRLVREIGRGGSGVVYEAEHLDLGRRVALKLIDAEQARSPELSVRFRREARTLSRLSHEGLVAVHDVGQSTDGRLFCVMELLEGETLEARLAREKQLDVRAALDIGGRVLAALEVAHGAALVHRDIKPANVFLPRAGGIKLLDFGLARGLDETPPDADKRGFTLYGTPEYMAPEQAASGQIDARADLYALGCVLYEALAGRRPFVGPSSVAVLDAKLKGSPVRLSEAARAEADEIPDAVDALVMKALARHPSQRFQTATEMRQAMAAVRGGASRGRGKRTVAVLAFAMVALFGVAAFAVKGKPLRASLPWLRARAIAVAVATPAAPATAAPTAAPAATEEVVDLGPIDEGVEDGDFVDDGLPPAPAEPAAAVPAADPAPPATSAEPVAVAEKPHHRRHPKTKAAKPDDVAPGDDADARHGGPKTDKPARHKHKAKVARVE